MIKIKTSDFRELSPLAIVVRVGSICQAGRRRYIEHPTAVVVPPFYAMSISFMMTYKMCALADLEVYRGGRFTTRLEKDLTIDTDYILLVNRARPDQDHISDIWSVALNQPLPQIPVPLLEADPDVAFALGAAVAVVYEYAVNAR